MFRNAYKSDVMELFLFGSFIDGAPFMVVRRVPRLHEGTNRPISEPAFLGADPEPGRSDSSVGQHSDGESQRSQVYSCADIGRNERSARQIR